MTGPRRFATASGKRRHTAEATRNTERSGLGGGGEGLRAAGHGTEYDERREDRRDPLEQCPGEDRRAQVPHVPSEHVVERAQLVRAESRLETFLLRAADLTAQLGREGRPQRLG